MRMAHEEAIEAACDGLYGSHDWAKLENANVSRSHVRRSIAAWCEAEADRFYAADSLKYSSAAWVQMQSTADWLCIQAAELRGRS